MKPEEQEYSSKNILANGNRRYEDHDYASALECAERAIKENQQDKDAWLLKGISLREMGRVYEAIKCLNAAISLDKLFYYAYIENCAAHLALDEIDQASKCVAEALKIHPRSSNAYGWKGFVEFFSGQYRSAITSFRQAIKYEQKERCANFRTNIGDALSSLEEYDKALDCYATASQLDKRDALPIIGVASIFLEKYKDKERADKKFSEAIELDPNAVYAYWIDLGVRLQKEGKDEEAIDYFNKALASDSQFKSLALINKGLICFIKNDYIASINLFESAIGYVSNYSPIAIICKSLALSKAGDFEAAVECYRGAYEFGIAFQNLLPKEVIYKSNLGILYFFKCFDTSLLDS